jgi:hypothetical protein
VNEFIRGHGVRLVRLYALLGVGKVAQRTENRETADAPELPPSWESARCNRPFSPTRRSTSRHRARGVPRPLLQL